MPELLPATNWCAASNPRTVAATAPSSATCTTRAVIGWECIDDPDDGPQLRGWINGRHPVPSDHFAERINNAGWILNHFTVLTEERRGELRQRNSWREWNWP